MSKKKLFEDIKQNPPRIYRAPADVLRDRRFADAERLEILQAWRQSQPGPAQEAEIDAAIAELEGRLSIASGHAAE
jgi:hypothetical protein